MIITGAAPTGASYLAVSCAALAVSRVTLSKSLAGVGFNVWGSVGNSPGGEPNDLPLGQVFGGTGSEAQAGIPITVPLARDVQNLIFQQIAGGVATGTIEVEGATWARNPQGAASIPTTPGTYSNPISLASASPCLLFALDEAAGLGDQYIVWGTNDLTTRSPLGAAGGTCLTPVEDPTNIKSTEGLRGGGAALLVQGFDYVIVLCVQNATATACNWIQTQQDPGSIGDSAAAIAGTFWPFAAAIAPTAPAILKVGNAQPIEMSTTTGGIARYAGSAPMTPAAGAIVDDATAGYSCTAGAGVSITATAGYSCTAGAGVSITATGGNTVIDASGTVGLANSAATQCAIGGAGSACASISIQTPAGGTINAGTDSVAGAMNLNTGSAVKATALGSNTGASTTVITAGNPGLNLVSAGGVSVGPTTPAIGAALDVQGTVAGVGIPNMTAAQVATWSALPPTKAGTLVYDTTLLQFLYWSQGAAAALPLAGGVRLLTQNTSGQSIPDNGTPTTIVNWTDVSSSSSFVDATGVFTAPVTDFYTFSVTLTWAAVAQALGAVFTIQLVVNGAAIVAPVFQQPSAGLVQERSQSFSVTVKMTAGQTAVVQASLSGGTGANVLTATQSQNVLSITQAGT